MVEEMLRFVACTFRRRAAGTSKEYLMPQKFDELLGANMIFAPAENGVFFGEFGNDVAGLESRLGSVLPVVYFIQVIGENGGATSRVVKL